MAASSDITIGDRIKTRRKEKRMSVSALAAKAGIAATTLYDLERNDSKSTTKLPAIADALGLNALWLETKEGPRLKNEAAGVREAAPAVYGTPITPEEAEAGREWGKLHEPARSTVLLQIQLMVAAQKRGEVRRDASGDGDGNKKRNRSEKDGDRIRS